MVRQYSSTECYLDSCPAGQPHFASNTLSAQSNNLEVLASSIGTAGRHTARTYVHLLPTKRAMC